jgi:hypothetical protein
MASERGLDVADAAAPRTVGLDVLAAERRRVEIED